MKFCSLCFLWFLELYCGGTSEMTMSSGSGSYTESYQHVSKVRVHVSLSSDSKYLNLHDHTAWKQHFTQCYSAKNNNNHRAVVYPSMHRGHTRSPLCVQRHQFGHVIADTSLQDHAVLIRLSESETETCYSDQLMWQKCLYIFVLNDDEWTYSKCCLIWVSSAYLEMPLMNKVRFTCKRHKQPNEFLHTHWAAFESTPELSVSYQVVLLVVHLGRVSPHAVDGQQQIHEGKRSVEPQQIRPGTIETLSVSSSVTEKHWSCSWNSIKQWRCSEDQYWTK